MKEYLHGHEGAILLNHLTSPHLVEELLAVIVDVKGDLRPHFRAGAVLHRELHALRALPVNRDGVLLIGEGIDRDAVSHHEGGVETESEMSDDLVLAGLVFISLHESSRSREGDVIDKSVHFVRGHAKTGIDETNRARLGIHDDVHTFLIALRQIILSHGR